MSKAHEETWETGEGVLAGALYADGFWIGSFTTAERARLAKEAPVMARALLAELEEGHTTDCVGRNGLCNSPRCVRIRIALRFAGVLP